MKLSEIKALLPNLERLAFVLENGEEVPEHFHVTELGVVTKHFIDCGGTIRTESKANFQLWNANDFDHRLKPTKLLNIIQLSEEKLGIEDLDIEIEYQTNTIGRYQLMFKDNKFVLVAMQTACLAEDHCGISPSDLKIKTPAQSSCCTPGGGCC
jgi:hypothetical protein